MDNRIVLTIGIVLVIVVIFKKIKSHDKKVLEKRKQGDYNTNTINIENCGNFDYLGGYNEITDKLITYIKIINKEFLLFTFYNKDVEIKIPLKDIIDVSTKMEDEVSKDVTLTRLLVFNIFAFGLKKERHNLQKFLIIKYLNEKQEEKTLIFGRNKHPENAYKMIKENINNLTSKVV